MNKNLNSIWLVDVTLFAGFLVTFFLDLTGLSLHQWIGVAVGALTVVHLLAHWNWISTITRRFFGKTILRARLYYLLDMGIFAGLLVVSLTGLVISSWLNLSLSRLDLWLSVHIQSSIMTLVLIIVKVGLHWRWVTTTTRKVVSMVGQQMWSAPAALQPVPVNSSAPNRQQISRRDFLKMMGIVSVASLLAVNNALGALQDTGAEQTTNEGVSSSSQASSNGFAGITGESQVCSVACGRRCSFPGHCRRYTDANSNNLCDLGECA